MEKTKSYKLIPKSLVIYTDGGARNNPGPAAIAAVIGNRKYSEYIGETTNNEAEYRAVIFGLKKVKQLVGKKKTAESQIEIRLDSELIGMQLQGKYKIKEKNLFPFFIEIWNLKQDFDSVDFKIIPRSQNKLADRLVNQELDARGARQRLF